MQNQKKYDYIFISSRIDAVEFAYPVYANISAEKVLEQNKNQSKVGEYQFRKFDNVYIGPIPDSAAQKFLDSLSGISILYIGPYGDIKYLSGNFQTYDGKDKRRALIVKTIDKKK